MLRTGFVLGLLALVGPFAIDMYLPAMPQIAEDFAAPETAIQMTLTAYFIAFGLAQLIYGPLADRIGRRQPILIGLVIFAIGSAGAALAPSAAALATWRFVQGLGGAALMVIPRAIVRDMYTGHQATRLMAMIMLVISVSPMLAPLAGSAVIAVAGWRDIFAVLAVTAGLSIALTIFFQPETLPRDRRKPMRLKMMFRNAGMLLTDTRFMSLTLMGGFGMASFFVFIASAPFVYTKAFGLTPTGFSIAFAINAIGFFSASQMASTLGRWLGMDRLVRLGVAGFAIFTIALVALALAGAGTLPVIVAGLFCANACLGTVIPTAMVLSLDDHGEVAGLASSLGGTLQMLAGGVMIAAAGPFFDGSALPMLVAIGVCGVAAFLLSLALRPSRLLA